MAGQRSNQLNYVPTRQINKMRNRQCLCGIARIAYNALLAFPCLKERCFRRNRPQTAHKFLSGLSYCPGLSAPMARKKTQQNEPRRNILAASRPARKGARARTVCEIFRQTTDLCRDQLTHEEKPGSASREAKNVCNKTPTATRCGHPDYLIPR